MSLQDVPVHNYSVMAGVMFDNGSEITLVSNFFARKNNLPYEWATYTLAGIGSKATTYNSNNNGKIYTVPLEDSNGEIVLVKAFAVERILEDKIGRDKVNFNNEDFPHVSKEVIQEAAKSIPRKYLYMRIENPDLAPNLYVNPDLVVKTVLSVAVCINLGLELDMSFLDLLGRTTLSPLQSNT